MSDLVDWLRTSGSDEWCSLMLEKAADRIAELEAQLKTVLDRETATHARHDDRIAALEASNARLREATAPLAEDLAELESLKPGLGQNCGVVVSVFRLRQIRAALE